MVRWFLFFIACVCPVPFLSGLHPCPKNHSRTFYDLDRSIQSSRWDEAGRTVRKGLTSGALFPIEIEMLANTYPDTLFAKAFSGATALLSLSEKTGLTLATAFPITLFAESDLAEEILRGRHFWAARLYGRDLQYDPETSSFYIHLGTRGIRSLATSNGKVITKTILYDRLSPCVMAQSSGPRNLKKEISLLRKLRGSPGIILAEGLMSHKDPRSKRRVRTIVTKIFNGGTLQSAMNIPSLRLSLREKIAIATDIVAGLASLHEKRLIHRDLSPKTYFVNIEKGSGRRKVHAVIADLRRVSSISNAAFIPLQDNKGHIAPEGFFCSRLHGTDCYGMDVFAVGTTLWQLAFGRTAPWQARKYSADTSVPIEKRYSLLVASIKRARSAPLDRIRNKMKHHERLTLSDEFSRLVLQMTDPVAHKRGTAHELKRKFAALQ